MTRLVVGVGSGRCGTSSLAALLSHQAQATVTHERYGPRVRWGAPPSLWALRLWQETAAEGAEGLQVAGDVAFYWLPQLDWLLGEADRTGRDVRVIGLKRPCDETVESYIRWVGGPKGGKNHWQWHEGDRFQLSEWDHCYPWVEAENRGHAIAEWWHAYYAELEQLAEADERVQVFPTSALNEEAGVRAILEHAGFDEPVIETGIRENAQ